jgi:alkylhydroperoxidase family enzyme
MLIEPLEPDRAPAVVRRIFEALEKRGAPVSNLVKMLAHKPDVLRAYNQLSGAIWAESALSARLKELAYLRVSILNGCTY